MATRTTTASDVETATTALVEVWRTLSTTAGRFPALMEARFGLTANRLHALVAIETGAVRVQDVADLTWTSVSATSRTVDALVRDGYVDRQPDHDDRRATVLTLTASGRTLVDGVYAWRRELMRGVAEALGAPRVLEATDALQVVDTAVREALDRMREDS